MQSYVTETRGPILESSELFSRPELSRSKISNWSKAPLQRNWRSILSINFLQLLIEGSVWIKSKINTYLKQQVLAINRSFFSVKMTNTLPELVLIPFPLSKHWLKIAYSACCLFHRALFWLLAINEWHFHFAFIQVDKQYLLSIVKIRAKEPPKWTPALMLFIRREIGNYYCFSFL